VGARTTAFAGRTSPRSTLESGGGGGGADEGEAAAGLCTRVVEVFDAVTTHPTTRRVAPIAAPIPPPT